MCLLRSIGPTLYPFEYPVSQERGPRDVEKDCILDAKMVKNLMEDKKLDFDAPLLSVRRLSAEAAAAAAAASSSSTVPPAYGSGESGTKPPPRRFSLPFYRSELKSGPVCNPGVVPFVWEQTPGQPKSGGGRRPTDKELHSSREATAPPAKLGSSFTRRGDYSPTARRSIGGAVSPYRYEAPPSPFREGRGFLGVPGKESNSSNIDDGSRLDLKKTHADVAHHPEAEDSDMNSVQSPLPLLPPQSPSESWLLHTLPSVSSKKNPTAWSFLGLGFQPREQALTHLEQRTNTKPSKPQRRHARFAAVFILLL
ncbi:hypothetical protein GW17_00039491 [Ensete ventricosum]|nr:hypothetical protein GW17_00039491 [Ensete ventricosum]